MSRYKCVQVKRCNGSPPPQERYAWLEKYKPVMAVGKSIKLYYIKSGN